MPDPVHDSITTVTAKVTPVVATGVLAFAPRFEVFSSVTLLPILVGYSSAVNFYYTATQGPSGTAYCHAKRFTNGADGEDLMEYDYPPVRAIRRVEVK